MAQSRVNKIQTTDETSRPSFKDICIKSLKAYAAVRWGINFTNTTGSTEITTSTSTESKSDPTEISSNSPSDSKIRGNMPYPLRSDFAILYIQSQYMSKANAGIKERAFNDFASNVINNTSITTSIPPKLLGQKFFDTSNPRLPTTMHNENSDGISTSLEQDILLMAMNQMARLYK